MTLKEMEVGQWARVLRVGGTGALRQHILDMGVIPGTVVYLAKLAPLGDPMELRVHGYALSMRKADAVTIEVEPAEAEMSVEPPAEPHEDEHPGLGEGGRYHDKTHESALPKETVLRFALAGNQNCGKTTLFNQLTGSNQHVGNFPGVTVDRKDGVIRHHPGTQITDLPGIYSLAPYTSEEIVSRDFILRQHPHAIINIIDATNIERNLYLTMQLMELEVPMVLALNMMDEVRGNGGSIRTNELEASLGLPVVSISAAKNEGIEELVEHALHVARFQEKPARQDFCGKDDFGGAVHRCLHGIMHLIEDHARRADLPVRYAASRLIDGDTAVENELELQPAEKETIAHIIAQMEEERGLDRNAAMADMRYNFIRKLCEKTVVKPHESKEYIRSSRIDRILTGKWTALPIFVAVMSLVIWLSIDVLGAPLQDLLDRGIQWLAGLTGAGLARWGVSPAVQSLVVDGIFGGVGTVVSFVPIIIILFFFLSLLEDSGYMARVAFVSDKLLRHLGLTGRSIVPLLIGFGCSVPAVMSTRTLPSAHDRRLTVLLTPYMSCSAKIPIYAFFTSAFFPGKGGLVLVILYLSAIFFGILVALLSKWIHPDRHPAPFVMELPNYRMPGAKNVGHLLWDKTKDFLQRAFTVIFIASIVIWLLQTFNFRLQMVENGDGSMLAQIAGLVAPIFAPMGLDDWRIVTALITGFLAKEAVVSTMEVLDVTAFLTPVTAIAMLAFCLLYTPCVAAIAAVKRELGGKLALWMVIFQCLVAWIAAFLAFQLAGLFIG
ncbi:MAG: ferrous iron transport protein B [Bacteroidales bacterium]|nr:ferrous iron transport protein B [Bacteroidales bacterium]